MMQGMPGDQSYMMGANPMMAGMGVTGFNATGQPVSGATQNK